MARMLAMVGFALVAGVAASGQSSFVIQGDYKLGGYAVKADGTLGGAVDVFGPPSSKRRRFRGTGCDVAWRPLALRMHFYNLGGQDACSLEYGRFARATVTSRAWRTSKGLRVADPVAKLRRLYPRAPFHPATAYEAASWWLVVRTSLYGERRAYPGLSAQVRNGRVSAFVVAYAAGGD